LPDTIPNETEESVENQTTIDVPLPKPKDYEEVTEQDIMKLREELEQVEQEREIRQDRYQVKIKI